MPPFPLLHVKCCLQLSTESEKVAEKVQILRLCLGFLLILWQMFGEFLYQVFEIRVFTIDWLLRRVCRNANTHNIITTRYGFG